VAATEIGVDVEKVDAHLPLADIRQHSFSGPEQDFIGCDAASRPLFYQSWTRKEALAKATAQGIDADFPRLPALDGTHYLAQPEGMASPVAEWLVRSFQVAPEYPAAVAYPASWPPAPLSFHDVDARLFQG
jgi:4'-phosphopantetheinyl transferase